MYKTHPTHGAGTWPHRTQLRTAARKTTLNAGQCVRQPREGRGRNRQAPPRKKKKKGGGKGKRHENSPQPPNHPPTPPQAARPPPPEKKKKKKKGGGTPAEAQGDHPPKTGNTKPVTADHGEKGHEKKKNEREPPAQPERKGMEGQGPQSPEKKKKRKEKTKAQKKKKKHPDNPAKKGWAQARPGPSTHAHTARRNRKQQGGKRGAHETTLVPKAGRNRSPTTNTTNSRH